MDLDRIENTNSRILVETASRLGIKVTLLNKQKLKLKLTKGGKTHVVTKKSFGLNPSRAIELTRDKGSTTQLLKENGIPTPRSVSLARLSELNLKTLPPFPLVVKPSQGQKGHDVYVGIKDEETLSDVLQTLSKTADGVIIQEYIRGDDLRFFVLNGKVIGASRRHPPEVTGNGKSSIKELIHAHNQKLLEKRKVSRLARPKLYAKEGRRMQNRILNWPRVAWHLKNQGLSLKSVLPKGKTIKLYPIANFQAGGTVQTLPLTKIHPSIIKLAEKAARATGLIVCGIDMIVADIHHSELTRPGPVSGKNAVVLEVNSDPSLRINEWPNRGQPQPVCQVLIQYIFREK